MPIDLSIIIVSWNTRDLLAQCLESVISQRSTVVSNLTTDDWRLTTEIFVVDNASSDGSAAMVNERFPQARLTGFRASMLGWFFLGGLVAIEQWNRGEGEQGRQGDTAK